MAFSPAITPPTTIGEGLAPLSKMSESEFSILSTAVSGTRSFSLSKEQIEEIQKKLPSALGNLTFILGILAFLYVQVDHVVELGATYSDVIDKLVDDITEQAGWGESKKVARDRLFELLLKKDVHQRFKKIQRLQTGFIPNAIGFASFVDLRPDFTEDSPPVLKGFLKVIQVRIKTDAKSPQDQQFVFQLSEDALKELKKCIDRAQAKMDVLQADAALSASIIKG
jgi:hypothetical protein